MRTLRPCKPHPVAHLIKMLEQLKQSVDLLIPSSLSFSGSCITFLPWSLSAPRPNSRIASTSQPGEDFPRRVTACQTYQISVSGSSYLTSRICILIQEAVQPKPHHKPRQPFGWCRCNARLDPSKRRS